MLIQSADRPFKCTWRLHVTTRAAGRVIQLTIHNFDVGHQTECSNSTTVAASNLRLSSIGFQYKPTEIDKVCRTIVPSESENNSPSDVRYLSNSITMKVVLSVESDRNTPVLFNATFKEVWDPNFNPVDSPINKTDIPPVPPPRKEPRTIFTPEASCGKALYHIGTMLIQARSRPFTCTWTLHVTTRAFGRVIELTIHSFNVGQTTECSNSTSVPTSNLRLSSLGFQRKPSEIGKVCRTITPSISDSSGSNAVKYLSSTITMKVVLTVEGDGTTPVLFNATFKEAWDPKFGKEDSPINKTDNLPDTTSQKKPKSQDEESAGCQRLKDKASEGIIGINGLGITGPLRCKWTLNTTSEKSVQIYIYHLSLKGNCTDNNIVIYDGESSKAPAQTLCAIPSSRIIQGNTSALTVVLKSELPGNTFSAYIRSSNKAPIGTRPVVVRSQNPTDGTENAWSVDGARRNQNRTANEDDLSRNISDSNPNVPTGSQPDAPSQQGIEVPRAPQRVTSSWICTETSINRQVSHGWISTMDPRDPPSHHYPHNLTCEWVLTVASSKVVTLEIKRYDIPGKADCSQSYIIFYTGSSTSRQQIGGKVCGRSGQSNSLTVTSPSDIMTVRFVSDSDSATETGKGFIAEFHGKDPQ